ncbi:MAG: GTP-binding protein [Candidatus Lokiarchaeota archaeon]|nr:GTP-binding protein [Candidatus Lokiarchaeota archaeon]
MSKSNLEYDFNSNNILFYEIVMSKQQIFNFKIILIGSPGVGKTTLVSRFITDQYEENYIPTLGVNIMMKAIKLGPLGENNVRLSIWDVGGQAKWDLVRETYYSGAKGAIIVFDLTRPSTLLMVIEYVKNFRQTVKQNIPLILIGNKLDLTDKRMVDIKKALEIKKQINAIEYLETSALDGTSVNESFKRLTEGILK